MALQVVLAGERTLWEKHHNFDLNMLCLGRPWTLNTGYANYSVNTGVYSGDNMRDDHSVNDDIKLEKNVE